MFTTLDGLPNKVIMTVLASRDGSLWTGANCGGLSRFDGRHFRTYGERDGLRNSCVYALAEDVNNDLWIGTYGGGVFRFRDGRFTQYTKAQGLASNIVTAIARTRDGSLWLATPEGVSRVRDGQVRNYTTADGLSINNVVNLYEDRSGDLWVGTGKEINRLAGDRFVNLPFIPKGFVLPVGEDRSGAFYVAGPQTGVLEIEKNRPIRVSPDIGSRERPCPMPSDIRKHRALKWRSPTILQAFACGFATMAPESIKKFRVADGRAIGACPECGSGQKTSVVS